jgi:predicted nucleotidyltransferase
VPAPGRKQSFFKYPYSWILASEGAVRVLRELARHGGELSVPRLAVATGLTDQAVRNLVTGDLAITGIVESIGQGRTILYRLAKAHVLTKPLGTLFEAEEQRVQRVYAAVATAARNRGAAIIALWVYGSVARGQDRPSSDLDLAVVVDDTDVDGAIVDVRDELTTMLESERVSVAVVGLSLGDIKRLVSDDSPWWRNLLADAHSLFGPTPDALARELASTSAHG